MLSAEFLPTALVVALIPGTGVIYTVSSGLFYGVRASIVAAFGCTLGVVPHLLASILGLSLIFQLSAAVFQALKLARNALSALPCVDDVARAGHVFVEVSFVRTNYSANRLESRFAQRPQPQADPVLFCFSAAFHLTRRRFTARRVALPQSRFYARDPLRFPRLRPSGKPLSSLRRPFTENYRLAQALFCGGVCGAWQ